MSNQEPVYQHRGVASTVFDATKLNAVISESLDLDVSLSSSQRSADLVRLRYQLLAKVEKAPTHINELIEFAREAKLIINEAIWDNQGREKLLDLCLSHWKSKLLPEMLDLAIHSIKFKLIDQISIGDLIDIGFVFRKMASQGKDIGEFMFDDILPILKNQGLDHSVAGRAFSLIRYEYSMLIAHFAKAEIS